MESRVNIAQIHFLDNPAMFTDKFKLEITFEVFRNLPRDLEWELVYVGSGTSRDYDQVLGSAVVGPIPEGRHKFVFDADHPDISKIPVDDVVGVSVLLLRCKSNDQEFINMGWFVTNEYADEELKMNPPVQPLVDKLIRKVEIDSLRVTAFPIQWSDEIPAPDPAEGEGVFAEEALMQLNDNEREDEEDDADVDEMEAKADEEVDLNESFNERLANALDGMDPVEDRMEVDVAAGSNHAETDGTESKERRQHAILEGRNATVADPAPAESQTTKEHVMVMVKNTRAGLPQVDLDRPQIQRIYGMVPTKLREAIELRKKGKFEEAQEQILSALELDPSNAYLNLLLAELHYDRGEFSEALKLCKTALECGIEFHAANDKMMRISVLANSALQQLGPSLDANWINQKLEEYKSTKVTPFYVNVKFSSIDDRAVPQYTESQLTPLEFLRGFKFSMNRLRWNRIQFEHHTGGRKGEN